jgi:hypothetical protein
VISRQLAKSPKVIRRYSCRRFGFDRQLHVIYDKVDLDAARQAPVKDRLNINFKLS